MAAQQILIVEDDEIQRRQLARALNSPDYNTAEVGSGEEALKLLANRRFDLVISDLKMPGISGLELIGMVRGLPHDYARMIEVRFDKFP